MHVVSPGIGGMEAAAAASSAASSLLASALGLLCCGEGIAGDDCAGDGNAPVAPDLAGFLGVANPPDLPWPINSPEGQYILLSRKLITSSSSGLDTYTLG